MSSDTFSTAVSLLQTHTQASLPQLYTHLSSLLNRYTSGLSLPIALDTIPIPVTPQTHHEFTLVKTHPKPLLHLLKPTKSSSHTPFHAFFPPSQLPSLPEGTVLRLPISPVSADALTLAKSIFQHTEILQAHLPTLAVLIRLPFPKSLPLPHPHQTYTLQNIWNSRDLTPPAVYATLQTISEHASSLTLIDQPSSPPVTLTLLPARKPLLQFLEYPCKILVTAPIVTPTDDGFMLHDTPSSTFFTNIQSSKKRQREETPRLHSADSLMEKETTKIENSLTVHARVKQVTDSDSHERVIINIGNVDILVPRGTFQIGDELLLTGVHYHNTWIAENVNNISTMPGLLYCPFVTKFIKTRQATTLCKAQNFFTAFLRVRVCAVDTGDMVRLSVADCDEDGELGVSDDKMQEVDGVVLLKDRGFHQLFSSSKTSFLRLHHAQLREAVDSIRHDVWRIIVCCGVAEYPVLTACLRAS